MSTGKTVIVAMSGGVDSSVCAGLLLRQGYNVIGATLLFRPCDDDGQVSWCCGRGAEESARQVAQKLGFPHYVLDCAKEFEEEILRPAWKEYDRGRTPSPCILCNERIKFRLLLEFGKKLGATKVATGHYARVHLNGSNTLLRGKDPSKDQSYFLFTLSKEHLDAAIFPLGDYLKSEIRELARDMDLPCAERPESQDACFQHKEGGFSEALRQRFHGPRRTGEVVDSFGNLLGTHDGIHKYTVGQRKGLGIAMGRRAYVAGIEAARNRIVLTDDVEAIKSTQLFASSFFWTGGVKPNLPVACEGQIRYRHKSSPAKASITDDGRLRVIFENPQKAVAPGQAVVLYDGVRVIGGGWIDGTR